MKSNYENFARAYKDFCIYTTGKGDNTGRVNMTNFLRDYGHKYSYQELIEFRDMKGQKTNEWIFGSLEIIEIYLQKRKDDLLKIWTED